MREIPGIPYRFKDPLLLKLALSHRSLGNVNNERLEFLGDSILNFVVSARLFELKPVNSEGDLSRLRARIVRGDTLAKLASGLGLGNFIMLGEGEKKSGGFKRNSILADALEAVFGAVYLDGGYEPCKKVILHVCEQSIAALPRAEHLKDPKTRLQEWLQGKGFPLPEYSVLVESGPSHKKEFKVECRSDQAGFRFTGSGRSRRKAEQAAAMAAFEYVTAK